MGVVEVERLVRESLLRELPPDPRVLQPPQMFGRDVIFGRPFLPDEEFPGWKLTHMLFFHSQRELDGWIFEVGRGYCTSLGLVTGVTERQKRKAHFRGDEVVYEWVVEGWGWAVIQEPGSEVRFVEVSADVPKVLAYSKGTTVAYIAGKEGLVGISIGIPAGIEEVNLALEDERVSAKVRKVYSLATEQPD